MITHNVAGIHIKTKLYSTYLGCFFEIYFDLNQLEIQFIQKTVNNKWFSLVMLHLNPFMVKITYNDYRSFEAQKHTFLLLVDVDLACHIFILR